MKANRLQERLAKGECAIGHMILEFGTRGMPQMLAAAAVDFAVVDMEHSAFSMADVANMMAGFRGTEVAPIVRVPQLQYHFIARALDAGALGVMIPNVSSGEQARAAVDAAKYAPLGRRGVILGAAHTGFRRVDPATFMSAANANTTVICQIESQAGLEQLDEIASTPGVDILWVGQLDLTQSLGIPGQFHHPLFIQALKRVVDRARLHGRAAAIQPGSIEQAEEWMELGFNVISYSIDIFLYLEALTRAVSTLRGTP